MTTADIIYAIHKLDEDGMNALCHEMARDYAEYMAEAANTRLKERVTEKIINAPVNIPGYVVHLTAAEYEMLIARRKETDGAYSALKEANDGLKTDTEVSPAAICFEMSGHVANLSNYMLRVRHKIEAMDARIKELEKGEVAHHAV